MTKETVFQLAAKGSLALDYIKLEKKLAKIEEITRHCKCASCLAINKVLDEEDLKDG